MDMKKAKAIAKLVNELDDTKVIAQSIPDKAPFDVHSGHLKIYCTESHDRYVEVLPETMGRILEILRSRTKEKIARLEKEIKEANV